MTREIVICAALRIGECIVRGHRHPDCIQTALRMGLNPKVHTRNQGFVTSKNRFVSRSLGLRLQKAAGIESHAPDGYREKLLFSEDLY